MIYQLSNIRASLTFTCYKYDIKSHLSCLRNDRIKGSNSFTVSCHALSKFQGLSSFCVQSNCESSLQSVSPWYYDTLSVVGKFVFGILEESKLGNYSYFDLYPC